MIFSTIVNNVPLLIRLVKQKCTFLRISSDRKRETAAVPYVNMDSRVAGQGDAHSVPRHHPQGAGQKRVRLRYSKEEAMELSYTPMVSDTFMKMRFTALKWLAILRAWKTPSAKTRSHVT
jgi:hypothetical protein